MSAGHCTHKISICISTFDRPQGLERLLQALDRLQLSRLADDQVSMVIVDNSATQSAADICALYAARGRFAATCIHEPRKGLCHARNAALLALDATTTHVAFIDDDEAPAPKWLENLLAAALAKGSVAAAIGPVRPVFDMPPAAWLPVDAFTIRRQPNESGFVSDGYTCNAIVDWSVVRKLDLRFDIRFNETGGEDTLFFRAIRECGFAVAWAEDAIVYEFVPPRRMSAGWLFRRWYRTGGIEAHLGRFAPSSRHGRAANFVRGAMRIAGGGVRILGGALGAFAGKPQRFIASFYTLCRGAGLIANSFGRDYKEYSRQDYR